MKQKPPESTGSAQESSLSDARTFWLGSWPRSTALERRLERPGSHIDAWPTTSRQPIALIRLQTRTLTHAFGNAGHF